MSPRTPYLSLTLHNDLFLSLIDLAAYCKKMPVVEDTKLPHSGNVASADHSLSIWDPKTFQQFLEPRRRTSDSIGSKRQL